MVASRSTLTMFEGPWPPWTPMRGPSLTSSGTSDQAGVWKEAFGSRWGMLAWLHTPGSSGSEGYSPASPLGRTEQTFRPSFVHSDFHHED